MQTPCCVQYLKESEMVHAILNKHPVLPGVVSSTREELSIELEDFLLRCLHRNPQERPTAQELLAHPWMEKHTSRYDLKHYPF